jgi:hypothetical protein
MKRSKKGGVKNEADMHAKNTQAGDRSLAARQLVLPDLKSIVLH